MKNIIVEWTVIIILIATTSLVEMGLKTIGWDSIIHALYQGVTCGALTHLILRDTKYAR